MKFQHLFPRRFCYIIVSALLCANYEHFKISDFFRKYSEIYFNFCKKILTRVLDSWADLKNFMRKVGEVTYTDAHVRSGEGKGEVCFKDRKGLYRAMKKLDKTKVAGKKIRLKIMVRLWSKNLDFV